MESKYEIYSLNSPELALPYPVFCLQDTKYSVKVGWF